MKCPYCNTELAAKAEKCTKCKAAVPVKKNKEKPKQEDKE